MRTIMKKAETIRILIGIGVIILLPAIAHAQPPDFPNAPIDGGLSLLLAGGIGYGIKKIRAQRSKQLRLEKHKT
jgi:hypothetical protein